MEVPEMIPALEFCVHHDIEMSFIESLSESGLIHTTLIRERIYLTVDELPLLKKFIRFHYEMDINIEGIETVSHLLTQLDETKTLLTQFTNRLRQYERLQTNKS